MSATGCGESSTQWAVLTALSAVSPSAGLSSAQWVNTGFNVLQGCLPTCHLIGSVLCAQAVLGCCRKEPSPALQFHVRDAQMLLHSWHWLLQQSALVSRARACAGHAWGSAHSGTALLDLLVDP